MPAAMRSLYGHKDREQTVYTGQDVLDALSRLWPDGVRYDPCAGSGEGPVMADCSVVQTSGGFAECLSEDLSLIPLSDSGGLATEWPEQTYVNPPFNDLKTWLPRIAKSWETVALIPVRTHRKWWRSWGLWASAICWMDPHKFEGFDQTFPAALSLHYWGSDVDGFCKAFSHLGTCEALGCRISS